MGFYLDVCNSSMKHKYLDPLSQDDHGKCVLIEERN